MLDIGEPLLDDSIEQAEYVELPRRKEVWQHLKRSKVGIAGFIITGGFILTAIFGPMLPFLPDPAQQDLEGRLTPPVFSGGTWEHCSAPISSDATCSPESMEAAQVSLFVGPRQWRSRPSSASRRVHSRLSRWRAHRQLIMGIADIQIAFPGDAAGIVFVAAFGPGVWR